jgi:hypothetical protein
MIMKTEGAKVWFIPDGYLAAPMGSDPNYKNHESVCVINTTDRDAYLKFDFYFADRDPIKDIEVTIGAERCVHVRMDHLKLPGGGMLPFDVPYGARIRSSEPIVVQYSRMYSTNYNISLMTTMAHPIEE